MAKSLGDLMNSNDDARSTTDIALELHELEKDSAALAARVTAFRSKFHGALSDDENAALQSIGVSIAKAKRAMGARSLTKNGSDDPVSDARALLAQKYAERDKFIASKTGTHRERQDLGRSISVLEVALSEYAR